MGVQEYHRQPILQALFQRLHFACWYLFVLTLIPGKSLLVMDHLHYCGKTHCSYLLTHLMVHYCDGLLSSKASSQPTAIWGGLLSYSIRASDTSRTRYTFFFGAFAFLAFAFLETHYSSSTSPLSIFLSFFFLKTIAYSLFCVYCCSHCCGRPVSSPSVYFFLLKRRSPYSLFLSPLIRLSLLSCSAGDNARKCQFLRIKKGLAP
jgi:hypothetical protein